MLMKIVSILMILLGLFLTFATHDMHLGVGFYAPHPVHVSAGVGILLVSLWLVRKAFRPTPATEK